MTPTWTLVLHSNWHVKPDTVLAGYLSDKDAKRVGAEAIQLRMMENRDGRFVPGSLVYVGFSVLEGPPILPPLYVLNGARDSLLKDRPDDPNRVLFDTGPGAR